MADDRHDDPLRAQRAEREAARARSGVIGSRFPRTGTEPWTAQSALGLRRVLAAVFLPLFTVAAVLLGVWAANSGPGDSPGRDALTVLAALCGALALTAAFDLWIVGRRLRREREKRGERGTRR
ncbi:hypothetical protein ACFOOM_33405 [Streptomyces echinoruber]|uniref:hypothetical protein n=1 Tax=Streptomyces echinoruber TaxID=68898 RepID=UPI0027E55802|nr:hypothetical protein [Streptomyces echinoruber]